MTEVTLVETSAPKRTVRIYGDEKTGEVWRFDIAMSPFHPLSSLAYLLAELTRDPEDGETGVDIKITKKDWCHQSPIRLLNRAAMHAAGTVAEYLTGYCESAFEIAACDGDIPDDESLHEAYEQDAAEAMWSLIVRRIDEAGRVSMRSAGTIR